MLQEKRHDFLFYIKSNFLFGKLYACLESIYFVFMLRMFKLEVQFVKSVNFIFA